MKKYSSSFINLCTLILAISILSCAKKVEDPLKHTKRLAKDGHVSLYNNGAFKVPYSSLRLIPPGPDAIEFAGELAGIRARQSLSLSLKKAAESVDVVVEGTKDSYELAKKISKATGRGAEAIRTEIGGRGTILVSKSYRAGKDIAVKSWEFSREKLQDLNRLAGSTVESFGRRGERVSEAGDKAGDSISERSGQLGSGISEGSIRKGREIAGGATRKGDEISEGSIRKGDEIAADAIRRGDEIALGSMRTGDEISEGSIRAGKEIIKWPGRKGKELIKESIRTGDEIASGSVRKGDEIGEGSIRKGDEIIDIYRTSGEELIDRSIASAKDIYRGGERRSRKALHYGYEQFVQGYAALPSKIRERGSSIGESLDKLNLWNIAKDEWERAETLSKPPKDMVVETISGYPESAAEPFKKAKKEITEGYKTSSLSFSILKSMGLVVRGLFWDATIEPAAKITAGSLGYIGVNMLAYPSMVVVREGAATVEVAAEVTWNTARTAYDIVAPTPIAAVAAVYGLVDFTASNIVAGTTATMGSVAGFGEKRVGEVAGVTVKGAGKMADVGTKVLGQTTGAAVKGGGTVAGAALIGAGTVAGAPAGVAVMGAGQVAAVTTKGAGQVAGLATKGAGQVAGLTTKGAGQVAAVATKGAGQVAAATVKGTGVVTGLAVTGTGKMAGLGVKGTGKVAGLTVKGAGYAGAGLQYIGVPIAAAGITIAGGTAGTAIGTAGGITGGTVRITGETGAAATQLFGNTIAGTTLVGGTALSTATGTAVGVYQLSKAVVVPAGYELGSGIVLSYGTLSHIAAHSILAVSDASYMVLSLEGPRWVLYAVRGNLDSGEDIPAGTILDLKEMQAAGEEIIYLPVSDEEMANVVNSVYENLPEAQ